MSNFMARYAARKLWNAVPDPLHYTVHGHGTRKENFWRAVLKIFA